jgi:hypothetical protein
MLTHATHNGVLALAIYYLPELKSRGWGLEERAHLPALWLVAAAAGLAIGAIVTHFGGRQNSTSDLQFPKVET